MAKLKHLSQLLLVGLLLLGCASQQGIIDRPDWAQDPIHWDSSGLTVASFGKTEYPLNSQEDMRQAEEEAMQNARRVLARQIAQAYLKASGATISEDEATRKVENSLGNLVERQSKYDEQRGVYYIQLFVPSGRIEEILRREFNAQLKMQINGELG